MEKTFYDRYLRIGNHVSYVMSFTDRVNKRSTTPRHVIENLVLSTKILERGHSNSLTLTKHNGRRKVVLVLTKVQLLL